MVSPPKPWERTGSAPSSIASSTPSIATTTPSSAQPPSSASPPSVPDRPPSLPSTTTPMSSSTSPYSSPYNASPYNRFGSTTYGGLGSYGGYGGYGSYGGMGGYNSFGSFGGYGGLGGYGMGGMGGMGYGMGGLGSYGPMAGVPQQYDAAGNPIPASLTQSLESTTHATFTILHSIVQTFTGMAQMLESTFMATHSSFFAMVGVLEQFSQLRNALGSVIGLFGLVRWLKELLTGRHNASRMGGEFKDFLNGRPVLPTPNPHSPQHPKPSKKPLIVFLLAIFGIPYAMHKLIKLLSARAAAQHPNALGHPNMLPPLDPSQLQFARALYPFQPSNPNELALKENDIVAIIAKLDPRTGMEVDPRAVLHGEGNSGGEVAVEGEWWKGRTRDGKEGWFPRKWVEVLERKNSAAAMEGKKVD